MVQLHDLIDDAERHTKQFTLWPYRWSLYGLPLGTFRWRRVRFRRPSARYVPAVPGIYAFCINPDVGDRLPANYVFYVGKHESNLRQRFRSYFKEMESSTGRPKVVRWLTQYQEYTHFFFSPITTGHLGAIEDQLIETIIPPTNSRYPASVSRVMAAF